MMDLADIFRGAVTPEKWKALGEWLAKPKITTGPGLLARQIGGQTVISARRSHGGGIGSGGEHPFQVIDASNGSLRVYVRPGMVSSGYWPSSTPTDMVLDDSDDDDKFYLNVSGSGYVLLKSVITGGNTPAVAALTLEYQSTIPANNATTSRLVIAHVTVDGGAITSIFQNVKSNLIHSLAFESYSYPDYWRQLMGPISPSL